MIWWPDSPHFWRQRRRFGSLLNFLMLETDWHEDRLIAWATELPTGHPVSPADLRPKLSELCSDPLLIAAVQTVNEPRAALAFDPAQAVDLLLGLSSACELSPTTRIWKLLTQFVVDRIAAGQFYPTVDTGDSGPVALWRVLVTNGPDMQWLQLAARHLSRLRKEPATQTDALTESFLNATTDAMIRRALAQDPFFAMTADRCRKPSAGADARFFAALLTHERALPELNRELYDQIRAWVDVLQEMPLAAAFGLLFKLAEPPEGDDESWRVQVFMVPLHAEMEPIPTSRLWDMGQDLPPILGRSMASQRQALREQLSIAAEAWPVLKRLSPDTPGEVVVTPAEAVAFARQWATRLIEAGFSVDLPRWARDAASELSIALEVRPADAEEAELDQNLPGRLRGDLFPAEGESIGISSVLHFDWRVAVGSMQLSSDQFQAILQANRPLVRFNDSWIQVDPDAASRAIQFINEHGRGTMTLADALRAAHATTRSDTGLEISGLTGTGWIGQFLEQSPSMHLAELQQPTGFLGQLRPYQLRGLQWLAFLHRLGIGACLADDMGLGKTIQFIALLLYERQVAAERNLAPPGPSILFAPTSVLGNWQQEVARFAPSLKLLVHHGVQRRHGKEFQEQVAPCDMVITTYALASRDAEDFMLVHWHRLALDEAQKIKNPSASSTHAIRSIPAAYRVALTGTPIENRLSELWSIMEVLNPGLLGTASTFREQFAVPVERLGDSSRASHLRDMIKPFVLRRTKSDPLIVGDLPEKLEMKVYCNLTVEQAAVYQRITDEMLGQIDSASGIRRRGLILAALTRLKQICNHPAMLDGKLPGFNARPQDLDERSGKCERLIEMLDEVLDEGDSALIFTQYKEMGDILAAILPRRLQQPLLYLHGGTPATKRDEMIRDFQDPTGKARIFLLSLRAGGLGLNLTRANHVFHFDRWWNPAVEQQATDRAHRIGQTRQVQVHKYVCIGTMEERIDRMITEKMRLADRIITSGDEWLTGLSTDELRRTLQLSPDAVDDAPGGEG